MTDRQQGATGPLPVTKPTRSCLPNAVLVTGVCITRVGGQRRHRPVTFIAETETTPNEPRQYEERVRARSRAGA